MNNKMVELINHLVYESESNILDFKSEQYKFIKATDGEKCKLLKDILAFANASRYSDAYILIGFKEEKGRKADTVGILEDIDDAMLQQFVNSKVNKPIDFSYAQLIYEEKKIAVITIPLQRRPFFLIKDYGTCKKDIVYIRHGSSTSIARPDEISLMWQSITGKEVIKPKLELKFENNCNSIEFQFIKFVKMTDLVINHKLNEFKSKYKLIPFKETNERINEFKRLIPNKNLSNNILFSLFPIFKIDIKNIEFSINSFVDASKVLYTENNVKKV